MSSLINIVEISMLHDINKVAVSSQNMANATTYSYKREMLGKVPFDVYLTSDDYYNVPKVVIDRLQVPEKIIDFSESTVKPAKNPLSISLRGNGFFVMQTGNGEVYTRNGNFSLDDHGRLVNQNGYIVQGDGGEIRLTTSSPKITQDGEIWENGINVGKLSVVEFDDDVLKRLVRQNDGTYISPNHSPTLKANSHVMQGYMEGSNVDSAHEMINTVETLRHFEMNQKILYMQQEMYKASLDSFNSF